MARPDPTMGGMCECEAGFTGFDCSAVLCPGDCYGHGYCNGGTCFCLNNWTGVDCNEPLCPNKCSQKGVCDKGKCMCEKGWGDADCARPLCPGEDDNVTNICGGHGQCLRSGKCECGSWV